MCLIQKKGLVTLSRHLFTTFPIWRLILKRRWDTKRLYTCIYELQKMFIFRAKILATYEECLYGHWRKRGSNTFFFCILPRRIYIAYMYMFVTEWEESVFTYPSPSTALLSILLRSLKQQINANLIIVWNAILQSLQMCLPNIYTEKIVRFTLWLFSTWLNVIKQLIHSYRVYKILTNLHWRSFSWYLNILSI